MGSSDETCTVCIGVFLWQHKYTEESNGEQQKSRDCGNLHHVVQIEACHNQHDRQNGIQPQRCRRSTMFICLKNFLREQPVSGCREIDTGEHHHSRVNTRHDRQKSSTRNKEYPHCRAHKFLSYCCHIVDIIEI